MLRLIPLISLILWATSATAKELPQGGFLLTGPVLPGIQSGHIVPVLVHADIKGDTIHWSFSTTFNGDAYSCEDTGKCARTVHTMAHQIDWQDDGTVKILDTHRTTGEGLSIDRGEDIYVYAALHNFLDNAQLDLDANGGVMIARAGRRSNPRRVEWHPMSLQEMLNGQAFVLRFELSMAQLNHCGLRQYARILNKPNRTPAEQDIIAAARYYGAIQTLEDSTSTKVIPRTLDDIDPETRRNDAWGGAMSYAVTVAASIAARNRNETNKPNSDAERAAILDEVLMNKNLLKLAEDAPGVIEEIKTRRHGEAMAAIHLSERYVSLLQLGYDPIKIVCTDLTMGG